MTKQKLTKEELRAPDTFQEFGEKILDFLAKNAKLIGTTIVVLLVAAGGWLIKGYFETQNELRAEAAIYKIENQLTQKREALLASQDALKDAKPGDKKAVTPSKEEQEKEIALLADQVAGVVKEYKTSKPAAAAAIRLAKVYESLGKSEQGLSLLQSIPDNSRSNMLLPLKGLQEASLAMNLNQFDVAVASFQRLLDDKTAEFIHAEVLVKMGLCFEKLNQFDRAKDSYLRASTEYSDTEAGRDARGYLRLLELNRQVKK